MSEIVKRIDALSGQVVNVVRGYVEKSFTAMSQRIDDSEARMQAAIAAALSDAKAYAADIIAEIPAGPPGPQGEPGIGTQGPQGPQGDPGADGKSVTLEDVAPLVAEAVAALPPAERGERGEPGPAGADGKSVTLDDVAPLIAQAVAALPPAERGEPGPEGPQGPQGTPGESIDLVELRAMINEAVALEVGLIPRPKDGADCDMSAVAELIETAIAKRWASIVLPKDGEPGRDAFEIDVLPGIKEGRRYERGTWARHAGGLVRAFRDTDPLDASGLQACGWDVMLNGVASIAHETDERAVRVRTVLTDGSETVSAVDVSTPYDAGVYKPGEKYYRGAGVSYGGSWFIAQVDDPQGAPEQSKDWRLAVKRGRDGKDGDEVKPPPAKIKLR